MPSRRGTRSGCSRPSAGPEPGNCVPQRGFVQLVDCDDVVGRGAACAGLAVASATGAEVGRTATDVSARRAGLAGRRARTARRRRARRGRALSEFDPTTPPTMPPTTAPTGPATSAPANTPAPTPTAVWLRAIAGCGRARAPNIRRPKERCFIVGAGFPGSSAPVPSHSDEIGADRRVPNGNEPSDFRSMILVLSRVLSEAPHPRSPMVLNGLAEPFSPRGLATVETISRPIPRFPCPP